MEDSFKDLVLTELGKVLTAQSIFTDLFFLLVIFLSAMGGVYASGRMFGVINSPRGRNTVGLTIMSLFSFIYIFVIDQIIPKWILENDKLLVLYNLIPEISKLIIFILLEIFLYVLLGMKLYTRIDSRLDKSLGEDSLIDKSDIFGEEYRKKHKKKKS